MKRGRIYTTAREKGYNVIAMGQHLDDLSESFLMSVFHNGVLRFVVIQLVLIDTTTIIGVGGGGLWRKQNNVLDNFEYL